MHKVRKISPLLNDDCKKLLLNALVLPHINYCCSSWNTMSAANTKKFESLIRSIYKIHPMNKTFQKMKTYNKLLMAFKGINNIAPRYLCEKFNLVNQRHNRNTRYSIQNNLTAPLKSNTFANRTFINSSTSDWNKLPAQLRTSNSIVTFKTSLKKCI